MSYEYLKLCKHLLNLELYMSSETGFPNKPGNEEIEVFVRETTGFANLRDLDRKYKDHCKVKSQYSMDLPHALPHIFNAVIYIVNLYFEYS